VKIRPKQFTPVACSAHEGQVKNWSEGLRGTSGDELAGLTTEARRHGEKTMLPQMYADQRRSFRNPSAFFVVEVWAFPTFYAPLSRRSHLLTYQLTQLPNSPSLGGELAPC
jgi:hypothetical protein